MKALTLTRDKNVTAKFYTEVFGLPPHKMMGHFAVVQVDDTSLDIVKTDDTITQRHFAFPVSEAEFDAIFQRIKQRGLTYWADPFRKQPSTINRWDDERGVYFDDPNGHLLEIITRP
ncbi:MAG: VOC family protein [Exilibacterium sp.]